MEKINELFSSWAEKMPFASDFFAQEVNILNIPFNVFFLILAGIALLLLIVAIVLIAVGCAKSKKNKAEKKAEASKRLESIKTKSVKDNETLAPLEEVAAVESAEVEELTLEEAPAVIEEEAEPVVEETPVVEEPAVEEVPVEEPVVEEVAAVEEPVVEEALAVEEPVVEEAPVVEEVPAVEEAPVVEEPVVEEPVVEEAPAATKAKKAIGTYEVRLCIDGYRFMLIANNGHLLYESVGFASQEGVLSGIETFRKTVADTPYIVTNDKYGRYRYVFNKRYQGENYANRERCASAAESVKRFAADAKLHIVPPTEEEIAAYTESKKNMRSAKDVDWEDVARQESEAKKMGKFEVICEENVGYRYVLIANNGQVLFTSAIYTSAAGALKGIDSFKKAVYIGNFYIDCDKFGRYRYIIRGQGNSTYVGESYESKAQAESSEASVRKFVVCANIIPFKKEEIKKEEVKPE